jgi:hypothetical protein
MIEIKNIDKWIRHGRGVYFKFETTYSNVNEILKTGLPKEYSPYSILCSKLVKVSEGNPSEFLMIHR